jgi:acylphosphatase
MAIVRARVKVTGRVQGVFYRDSARQEALARDVSGWVRNLPDGSVEAVFEGAPEAVDAMVGWAHLGPLRAEVESLERTAEEPEGLVGFDVRY